ncbi:MAG: RNB domain-containing ribonuclease, partial [Ostreibacterium sp.]
FRNHQGPSEEKLEKLITALAQEGLQLTKLETVTPKQLAEIIEKIQDNEHFEAIQMLVLRSMYQAVYQSNNIGHFGLALDNYAHFTSPIRRYPDLLVHRAIKHAIKYKKERYIYSKEQMQQLGEQCSMAERRADEAVYDVIGYLKCEYLIDKLGQQYAATISGVTNFGFFATLDNQFVDGLVHISSLDGDYFNYDDNRRILVGERSRKTYQTGDKVNIIISHVSVDDRRIDFILTEDYLPFSGKERKSHKKSGAAPSKRSRKPHR